MAGPLRGGGVKGLELFFKKICHLKITLFYFRQLIEIWTYHVCQQVFIWVVTIFSQKQGYYSSKIGGIKKLSKSVSGYFMPKKIRRKNSEKNFFLRLPKAKVFFIRKINFPTPEYFQLIFQLRMGVDHPPIPPVCK